MSDRRVVRLAIALPLVVVLATGCGAEPTGHGAPPYQEPSNTPRQSTSAPQSDGLTVKMPHHLPASKRAVARRFAAFEHALATAFQERRVTAAVKRLAYPSMQTQVANQIKALTKANISLPSTATLRVQKINRSGTVATVQACQIATTKRTPVVALMARTDSEPWRVTSMGPVNTITC